MSELRKNIFGLFGFSLLDRIVSGFLQLIIFTIVIRHLAPEDVGLLGIFGGIAVFFNLANISPSSIMIRDYPKIGNELDLHLGNYIIFSYVKMFFFLVAGFFFAIFLLPKYGNPAFTFLLYILFFSFQNFITVPEEALYVSFKNNIVFFSNLVFNLFQLGFFIVLFKFTGALLHYILAVFLLNAFFFFIMLFVIERTLNIRIRYRMDIKDFWKHNILHFTVWNHLNGAITYLIYRIDTFVLSFFSDLRTIASYTVALTVSNYFFIIPMIGEKALKVGYSRLLEEPDKEAGVFRYGTAVLNAISIFQYAVFLIFGKWFICFLFPEVQNKESIFLFSSIIIAGVTILNLSRPLTAYIFNKSSLRSMFLSIYLPGGLFSLAVYFTAGHLFGPIGVAWGNVVNYGFLAVLVLMFFLRSRR